MKNKSALERSRMSVRLLSVLIPILAALVYAFPRWWIWIPLTVAVLSWCIDAYNILWMRKRAAADPTFLDQRLE
jgi:hypothetical protein